MAFDANQAAHRAYRDIVAERTMPLLVWTGSGPSVGVGLPSWGDLRISLLDTLRNKAIGLEPQDAHALRGKADAIERQQNNWIAFKMLYEALGRTTYRETIKDAFGAQPKVETPVTYQDIWSLGVRGILTLNLDRLATRAHSEYEQGVTLAELSGRDIARLRSLLNGHQPFVGNLHGVIEDTESWVWTKDDLDGLLGEKSYQSFIETCLSTFTILFVGVSADDRSVGGHLERLASLDIETGPHFWLTDRRDYATDSWAEAAGIRLIRYDQQENHREVQEFFADLSSFIPEDPEDVFAPVAPEGAIVEATEELPSPTELLSWDAERIREALNARALSILGGEGQADYEAYDAFCKKFDQAIYRAWYTNTDAGSNLLFGYTLNREVAQGSFGRVYSATDPNGSTVAVKVLLEEVRRKPDLLRSFRRGVRSMRILHERDVSGMVAYLATSEIPAFVVMEWVDGPNLAEATQATYLKEWPSLLKVSSELAHTVRRAHELPERVLHRDLRPSNVMLSGYFHDSEEWRVVVLDFDLSWHRGAYEQSVLHTSAAGYLAPEQMRPIKGISTRNSAVDSFGLGMTLLYLCSGQDPSPAQHLHRDWEGEVRKACSRIGGKSWLSAPERFARLIIAATRDSQAARWDMAEITGELDRLMEAVNDPFGVTSAELVAEEVAARSEVMGGYSWDADQVRAMQVFPTGMQLAVATQLETQSVHLQIDWTSTGTEERGNLDKYIVTASKAAVEQLKSFGWSHVKEAVQQRTVRLEARLDAFEIRGRLDDVAESIDRATGKLRSLGTRSA